MKRLAIGIVFAGVISLVGLVAVGPAFAHGAVPNSVPTNTPSINILRPIASTHVHAGSTYSPQVSAVNVPTPPGIWFDYASPAGTDIWLVLDHDTGAFTIPSSWTPGMYRLKNVYIGSGGGNGLHQRDGEYIGFPASGGPEPGSFWLNMPALDLQVS